jgi:ELWxxDGT repeat protein
MTSAAWFGRWSLRGPRTVGGGKRRRSPSAQPPRLEALESRLLPSLTPHLLKDINPGPLASSNPSGFVEVNGTAFFAANDGTHGKELWKSNGTTAGTVLVKDINVGTQGSYIRSSYPAYLTNVNGTLFFTATDRTHGRELWRSNGAAAGTIMIKDINPSTMLFQNGSYPKYLTNVNDTLFFQANDGVHGAELWRSNGAAAGTVMVKDINPGSGSSSPSYLTNVRGELFFQANDGVHGAELWKSNGTAAGTVLVKDINPGSASSSPKYLVNVKGVVFFQASDVAHGAELWKSNGTAAGTVLLKDIHPGSKGSNPVHLTNDNGFLFFAADDGVHGSEPWRSNGTTAGTFLIKDINPGSGSSTLQINAIIGDRVAIVNGIAYFAANDGTHGFELWKSNGTAAGTVLVKDIYTGLGDSSYPENLTNVNGTLFFKAYENAHGAELWMSNGSAAGTVLVKDIDPGVFSSYPGYLTNLNGVLFFSASDVGSHNFEPWVLGPLPVSADVSTSSDGANSPSIVDAAFISASPALHNSGSPGATTSGGLTPAGKFDARPLAMDQETDSTRNARLSVVPVHRLLHTPAPQNDNLVRVTPWSDDL